MAVMVGIRAGICITADPSLSRSVVAATQASTVTAADPHDSAAQAEW